MAFSPEAISLLVVLALHFGLFAWTLKKLIPSKITLFEKCSWTLLALIIPLLGPGIYFTYERAYMTKKELFEFAVAIITLGFIFSFRMWGVGEFSVSTGINNWLRMCGLALVAYGLHIGAQKAVAKRYGSVTNFKLWKFAVVLAVLLSFITNGWFKWAAIGLIAVGSERFYRPGHKTHIMHTSPYEISLILSAGIFTSMGLAILGKLISGELAKQFFQMNLWIAVFSIIPMMLVHFWPRAALERMMHKKGYGEIKDYKKSMHWHYYSGLKTEARIISNYLSEGEWIFFGSRPLWVFTAVFVIACTALLLVLNAFLSTLIAAVLAVIMFAIWQWKMEPHTGIYK